jgi:hypothetical protein
MHLFLRSNMLNDESNTIICFRISWRCLMSRQNFWVNLSILRLIWRIWCKGMTVCCHTATTKFSLVIMWGWASRCCYQSFFHLIYCSYLQHSQCAMALVLSQTKLCFKVTLRLHRGIFYYSFCTFKWLTFCGRGLFLCFCLVSFLPDIKLTWHRYSRFNIL